MPAFLLVCDASFECSPWLSHELARLEIEVGYLRGDMESRNAVLKYLPDYLLIRPDADPAPLERLLQWVSRGKGLTDRPRLFLMGNQPVHQLADRWGWPKEYCLCFPSDDSRFATLLSDAEPAAGTSASTIVTKGSVT